MLRRLGGRSCGKALSLMVLLITFQPDLCLQPRDDGPCGGASFRWFYNPLLRQCEEFQYGGCGGNQNNFKTRLECERNCAGAAIRCPPLEYQRPPSGCSYNEETGNDGCPFLRLHCTGGFCAGRPCLRSCDICLNVPGTVRYRCERNSTCEEANPCSLIVCPQGTKCKVRVGQTECVIVTNSLFQRDRPAICLLPKDNGRCRASITSYFFDDVTESCRQFTFGGCGGNQNRFRTLAECARICIDLEECEIPPLSPPRPGCHYDEGEDDRGCPIFGQQICRKEGICPRVISTLGPCIKECFDDSDCGGNLKCCSTGCGRTCRLPEQRITPICPRRPIGNPPRGCDYERSIDADGCTRYTLVCVSEDADICSTNPCAACQTCIPTPENCLIPPCRQYRCESNCEICESCVLGRCVSNRIECRSRNHNPCKGARCPNYPFAQCRQDTCNCYQRIFFVDDEDVTRKCYRTTSRG